MKEGPQIWVPYSPQRFRLQTKKKKLRKEEIPHAFTFQICIICSGACVKMTTCTQVTAAASCYRNNHGQVNRLIQATSLLVIAPNEGKILTAYYKHTSEQLIAYT